MAWHMLEKKIKKQRDQFRMQAVKNQGGLFQSRL